EEPEFFPNEKHAVDLLNSLHDRGDSPAVIGDHDRSLRNLRTYIEEYASEDRITGVVGGDHSVSIPAFEACLERHPDLHLVYIDTHLDARPDICGVRNTHASAFLRAVEKLDGGKAMHLGFKNVGSSLYEDYKHLASQQVKIITASDLRYPSTSNATIREFVDGKNLYISLDLDALNPSEAPGVGTPSPGGLGYDHLVEILTSIIHASNLVGFDIVELCPVYDQSERTSILAATLIATIASLVSIKETG
ncbi:MAG: arginase family protein, partial [Pseudomonadota bacterium]